MTRAYVLVHPERWPSNDWAAVTGGDPDIAEALADDFDERYGAHVLGRMQAAHVSAAVLDPFDVEDLIEQADLAHDTPLQQMRAIDDDALQVTVGVPVSRCTHLLQADPGELTRAADELHALLPVGATVELGGFARHDCVAAVAAALAAHGRTVTIDDPTTLPLTSAQGYEA